MIFETLSAIIADQFGVDADTITMDTSFEEDLSADSLDIVDLSMSIEEAFGLEEMGEEDLSKITTVGDLVDVIQMENEDVLEQMILDQDVRELYQAYKTCLNDNEKQVVRMRYGLFGGKEYTQREIAKAMGLSRSYISRIEKRGLEKIGKKMRKV